MSSRSETRPRRNFGDLAKIADAPASTPETDREEGSGVVHLAALAVSERATVPVSSLSPLELPAEAAPRRRFRWRATLAGIGVFAALVVGALLGSLGTTEIRAALGGSERRLPSLPTPSAESDEEI